MDSQSSVTSPTHISPIVESYALTSRRAATLRQLMPIHRLAVIAKTPMLIAVGLYAAGGPADGAFFSPSVIATMALAAGLWTALYALNEATDLEREHNYFVERSVKAWLFAACVVVCLLAARLSMGIGLLLTAMAVGQCCYCVPPLRLKRHWWAVLLLSGLMNPILRLECGAYWGAHHIPPLAYAVFVSLHLGASIRSRVLLRNRDRKLGYRVAPQGMELVGIVCTFSGLTGAGILCLQGVLPRPFLVFVGVAAAFSVYAWSKKATSVAHLRQGWLWFTVLSLAALVIMLARR